jgi:copper oxidase (laccase) domain-containing protein
MDPFANPKLSKLHVIKDLSETFIFESGLTAQVIPRFLGESAAAGNSHQEIVFPKQCHGSEIVHFPKDFGLDVPRADGLWSEFNSESFLSLGVYTADCLPVCLSWKPGKGLGTVGMVVHAGWKGFADGILQKALHYFENPPTEVFMGPAIFGRTYECGLEVAAALETAGCENIQRSGDKCFPDLQALAAAFFLKEGVLPSNIHVMRLNTYDCAELPSYRRSCHQGQNHTSRMVTVLSNPKSSC